jgi:prevent-host-death family protein
MRMSGGNKKPIQEIAISKFKDKCLSLLQQVSKTKAPLRVTRRGKAIADVIPASSNGDERSWIGSLSGSVEIVGDVVSPVFDVEANEALKH